jgi:hypothetical protein
MYFDALTLAAVADDLVVSRSVNLNEAAGPASKPKRETFSVLLQAPK